MSFKKAPANEFPLQIPLDDIISTTKKRVRSDIERRRIRISELETYFKHMILNLEYYAKLDPNGIAPFYEYLNWVKLKLQGFKASDSEDESQLAHEIQNFEVSLKDTIHYYNGLIENYTHKHEKTTIKTPYTGYNLKQPTFEYNRFLENGLKTFINVVDVYQLWLKPSDLIPLLSKKIPDTLSYVFIATLAKFTLSNKDPNFKQIYGSTIRNARKSLPNAYKKPCIDNVIALGLMTQIALSHFNMKLIIRYFGATVRMAQSLGLDKEDCSASNPKDKRISNLWKGILLVYMILSNITPDFPNFNIKFKAFKLELPKNHTEFASEAYLVNNPLERMKLVSYEINKKILDIFINTAYTAQKIKMENPLMNPSLISNNLLRLPTKEFNECITSLMSIQKYIIDNDKILADNHNNQNKYTAHNNISPTSNHSCINERLKVIYDSTFIHLYYPTIMVYPQPVCLTLDELVILHHSANKISNYLLKTLLNPLDKNNYDPSAIQNFERSCSLCELTYEMPQYLQIIGPIYIYFNLLHQYITNPMIYPINGTMKQEAINNSLALIELLNKHSKFHMEKDFTDFNITINHLKKGIPRFTLPTNMRNRVYNFIQKDRNEYHI